jgi:phospholipid/cholesterol/gamma-HCH transport system substrate-binding protein
MKRLTALALLPFAAAAALALPGAGARGDSTYRVDAIFDTSKGIIPGQLVKVAGARVGKVRDVTLTAGYKARIEMEVERRFAPFRSDASCSIQPEGLLAENFVQCNPGTPAGRPLRSQGGRAPTVPVERTTVPVSLNDLFDIWNVPTRERLSVLVNELGIGFAGRGEDLNEVLRRANPSLVLARQTIRKLNRQRRQLAQVITDTDRVVAVLASRRDRVADFVDQAARVTSRTAAHSGALGESIRRLPDLLRAASPALRRLDEVSAAGTPLLRELRVAAPDVNRLVAGIEPFADAGVPALRGLDPALATALRATRRSRALMHEVRRFTTAARPLAPILSNLFVNTRDRGFIENGLKFLYYASASAARFDSISHILPAHIIFNQCAQYSTQPSATCDARYRKAVAALRGTARPRRIARPLPRRVAPGARPAAPAAPAPATPAAPVKPKLLPDVSGLAHDILAPLTGNDDDPAGQALEDLAGYLLG